MQPIHKEQQQLLRVLLFITCKLVIDLPYGDFEVSWTDALVQTSPESLHDHTKLFRHLSFMTKDVGSVRKKKKNRNRNVKYFPHLSKSYILQLSSRL